MNDYCVETIDETAISGDLDVRIRGFLCAHFPEWCEVFSRDRKWHRLAPLFTTLCRDDEEMIAHTAVVIRRLTTTWNFRYEVASIQGVLVAPEHRRHGLAEKLLTRALDEARKRGFLYAILFCKEPLVEYYLKQNWKLADDSMVMWNNRDLPIAMRSNCPMYYELTAEPWPEGPVDVHSFDD